MSSYVGHRPWRRAAAALALISLSAMASNCSLRAPAGLPQVKLEFEKYTLPNGLEVILHSDHRLPIVAVNLWYHVGPANELAGRTGFAHLFEHMMFQASGHVPADQFFPILEGAGASFINGTTDFDRTNYLEDVPSNQLELALWLESDRMGFLLDKLDQSMLSNQQDVVRNERRQSIENQPYGLAEEELFHQMFPREHPYHADVIGSHEDVQAARLEDVRAFFKRYYAPNNCSLTLAGDFDPAEAKRLIEKYFGTIARGADVQKPAVSETAINHQRRVKVTDRVELPKVFMGWITPKAFEPGDAEASLAARILAAGKASRLYRAMVYEQKIAQTVDAAQNSLALGSVFEVQLTAKPGHTVEELERSADAEFERLAKSGPTTEELRAAKTGLYSEIVQGLQNPGGFSGVANRLNLYNQYLGDPGYLSRDLARYESVTADGVKHFFAGVLHKEHRALVQCLPGEKVVPGGPPTPPAPGAGRAPTVSAEPWRSKPPTAGPVSTTPLPIARSFELPNGLRVLLVELHGLPVVAASTVIRAGSAADPADLPGLAGFVYSMLDEGAGRRDAMAIARDLETLGASLETSAFSDGGAVSVASLKAQAADALSILADVVTRPTFPDSELSRVRNNRLTRLVQVRQNPFATGIRVMLPAIYGAGHPYGHNELGLDATVKAVTRDQISSFYHRYFSPANTALVLAGDLTEAEARKLATRAFGEWSAPGEVVRAPEGGTPTAARITVVNMPSASQTALLAAQLSVTRADPDFEKLNIMNQVLGGLFSSRVNMNLREKHGYSYGAFSFIRENRGVGPLIVGSMVRGNVTGPSLREMMKEVAGMNAREISPAELTLARESISRSLPALFQTAGSTVGTVAQIYLNDQPLDYYESLPGRLASMSATDVFEATRRHLRPEEMRVIAVGDRRVIEPQLRALSMGSIEFRDADGRPIRP